MADGMFLGIDNKTWGAMAAFLVIFAAIFGGLTKVYIRLVKAEGTLSRHCEEIAKKADARSVDKSFETLKVPIDTLNGTVKDLTKIVTELSKNAAVLNSKVEYIEKQSNSNR